MTCFPRSPAAWKDVAASFRKNCVIQSRQQQARGADQQEAEDAAMSYVLEQLGPDKVEELVAQAVAALPEPLVRRNPTLSNPFVRGKVYELACGEPIDGD